MPLSLSMTWLHLQSVAGRPYNEGMTFDTTLLAELGERAYAELYAETVIAIEAVLTERSLGATFGIEGITS